MYQTHCADREKFVLKIRQKSWENDQGRFLASQQIRAFWPKPGGSHTRGVESDMNISEYRAYGQFKLSTGEKDVELRFSTSDLGRNMLSMQHEIDP